MSAAPSQFVLTNTGEPADCCCIHCPANDDCDACPNVLVQAPTYSWECVPDGVLACGGVFTPPLISISLTGPCQWTDVNTWCPGPPDFPYGILGGCSVELLGSPVLIERWSVIFEFWVSFTGAGQLSRRFASLFVNEEAIPLSCMPGGVYKHLATAVGNGSEPPQCEPVLTAPVGDLLVIET